MKCRFAVAVVAAFAVITPLNAEAEVKAQAADAPKVSILGDSYSTFEGCIPKGHAVWYFKPPAVKNGVDSPEKTWWALAIDAIGGQLEKNNSYSGATISFTGYGKADYSDRSFVVRASDLGNPDIILVFGATNDSWARVPLGDYKFESWTNEDLYVFRPAMAKLCSELKTLYPIAQVYFILNSGLKAEIDDSIHAICRHFAIPCIELVDIPKIGNHPDVAGMKAIADQVVAVVKKGLRSTGAPTDGAP